MPDKERDKSTSTTLAKPKGERVACFDCGAVVRVDTDALAEQKPDKLGRGHEDDDQRTARCPRCGGVAARIRKGRFIADTL